MRYFLGDLNNLANQLVLCSFAMAILMQMMGETFRRMSIFIVTHQIGRNAMKSAAKHARWSIGFQRASLALLCLALVTQQIRLQAVKEIAVSEGFAQARSVGSSPVGLTLKTKSGNVAQFSEDGNVTVSGSCGSDGSSGRCSGGLRSGDGGTHADPGISEGWTARDTVWALAPVDAMPAEQPWYSWSAWAGWSNDEKTGTNIKPSGSF